MACSPSPLRLAASRSRHAIAKQWPDRARPASPGDVKTPPLRAVHFSEAHQLGRSLRPFFLHLKACPCRAIISTGISGPTVYAMTMGSSSRTMARRFSVAKPSASSSWQRSLLNVIPTITASTSAIPMAGRCFVSACADSPGNNPRLLRSSVTGETNPAAVSPRAEASRQPRRMRLCRGCS
jgi:hypothetical protein